MCVMIWMSDGTQVQTLAQARGRFPVLVPDPRYPGPVVIETDDGESCCCPLDVEATAEANGYAWEREPCGDYNLTPHPARSPARDRIIPD